VTRVAPRRLAPVLFGAYDIAVGLTRATYDHAGQVPSYAKAASFVPISVWGWALVAVGLAVWAGALYEWAAYVSTFAAVVIWAAWAMFLFQTLPDHRVSPSGVAGAVGIAALHALLSPYRRDSRLLRWRPRSGSG
jgi:hypothetical protein